MDENILKKAKKGDKNAFAIIIQKIKNDAYKIAYCYLKNEEDSMDAVCDAIEKAYYNIKKLKKINYFKTWFIRIVINECKMKLNKDKRIIRLEYINQYTYNEDEVSLDTKIVLKDLLKKIPELERTLIYMKYYLGYTLEEISNIMNIPEGTVKTKIYSNLKKLKTNLKEA